MNNEQTRERKDIYQLVTNQVIEQLEQGVIPWKLSISEKGAPKSLTTQKNYLGINLFLLWWAPFDSRYWVTFNQAKKLGGSIRKGEKGRIVIYWHWRTEEQIEKLKEKTAAPAPCFAIYSTVFNLEQCEGINTPEDDTKTFEHSPIEEAARIIEQVPHAPRIEFMPMAQPGYDPDSDTVVIPGARRFEKNESYYAVLFHELAHATGHETRLNRLDSKKNREFGSPEYSFEELVAEMTAAFLCAHCGIENQVEHSAAYINSWLAVFRKDKKILLDAATAAQRAADYILGRAENVVEQQKVEESYFEKMRREAPCTQCGKEIKRGREIEACELCKKPYCGACVFHFHFSDGQSKMFMCQPCYSFMEMYDRQISDEVRSEGEAQGNSNRVDGLE